MTKITIDAELKQKLANLTEPVDLCDESGEVLGRFTPLVDSSAWEPITSDITEEEMKRRLNAGEKRYTTTEVMDHLGS